LGGEVVNRFGFNFTYHPVDGRAIAQVHLEDARRADAEDVRGATESTHLIALLL
jgi:hypothetical protein